MSQPEKQKINRELPVVVALQGPLDGRRWEVQEELIILAVISIAESRLMIDRFQDIMPGFS